MLTNVLTILQKAAEAEEQLNESTRIMEKLTLKLDDAIASSDRARLETHNQLTMVTGRLFLSSHKRSL